jgi:signal transduction histidine kinase
MEHLAEQRSQQLRDAERLAAIGATAGMVGHDIRNPLQAITGDIYLIQQELIANPNCNNQTILECLNAINDNIDYINKIVSDLQDYTKPIIPTLQKINLKELICGIILSANLPNNIDSNVFNGEIVVEADLSFLRRVFTNLIINAMQAMPNGGKLTVNVGSKNNRATVSIEDTGVGIPDEVKPNLFTPLFTTKSKGQGLGLAVVKRLVGAMKGTISYESLEGKGTKFIVEFPMRQTGIKSLDSH